MTKTIITSITLFLGLFGSFIVAQSESNNFFIIPESESSQEEISESVQTVWSQGWQVRDRYNEEAQWASVWDQLASGIMTWDTLLDYVVYIVRFLSQIGLLIGAAMIIYAGYLYATSVFSGSDSGVGKWKEAVGKAIIGVIVIASAYAIMRILTTAFL